MAQYNTLGPYGNWEYGSSSGSRKATARFNVGTKIAAIVKIQNTMPFRDIRGRYTNLQKEWDRVNRQAATQIRDGIAADTYARLDRPTVSTGRLRKAYMAQGNVQPAPGASGYQMGFMVMDLAQLDRSASKYWRLVEFGTKQTLGGRWTGRMVDSEGIPLFGRWGGSISGFYNNRWGEVARGGAPWGADNGKLRPAPQSVREAMLRPSTGQRPKAPYRKKHIVPKDSFEINWNKYGGEQHAQKLFRQFNDLFRGQS